MRRTLVVDNYDSFTYNLVDLIGQVRGVAPIVVRNDVAWASIPWQQIDNVVLSPGPGRPSRPGDFGICADLITGSALPILGVCLGFQGICEIAGAQVGRAPQPMHGRASMVEHDQQGLFTGIPSPFTAIRYHSLAVDGLPDSLKITATAADGVVMAVEHVSRPIWGVQFHPESICTEHGLQLIQNFCRLAQSWTERTDQAAPSDPAPSYTVNVRRIPVMADPTLIFDDFFAASEHAFWLDSGGRTVTDRARFSILGDAGGPLAEVVQYDVAEGRLSSLHRGRHRTIQRPLLEYLSARCAELAPSQRSGLELGFELGFVGYLGYEMKAETGGALVHPSPTPDASLILADRAIVHDAWDGSGWLLALSSTDEECDSGPEATTRWLDVTEARLQRLTHRRRLETPPAEAASSTSRVTLRHDRDAYLNRIERALELIRSGETYELCLTNQGSTTTQADPLELYKQMRRLSPVPFGAFLRFVGLSVLSASPERFLCVDASRRVESRPIKGTRPRGQTPEQDEWLRTDLQTSEKDRAENLMIVDLVRNDLSRVCELGSVHVPGLFQVETFATVHQLVSTVAGQLGEGRTAFDAVRAAFPGGSMTGAPKIRTMELIDDLEAGPRGVYSGALGWFSLTGACDLAIVIRTITMNGEQATFGTGGAILALSDPEQEWEETQVKSTVMHALLEGASQPAATEHDDRIRAT